MPGSSSRFSEKVAEILRNADRTIRQLPPEDHRRLYNVWRVTMSTLAPVDSFYVAFFRDDRYLAVVYVFDERESESPGFQMYGPAGLSAWIRAHALPYFYAMDNGRLMHMGHSFGDKALASQDAIAIPLFEATANGPTVVGLASMQTYRPNAYTEDTANAFAWLAKSVMTNLRREREDAMNRELLLSGDDDLEPEPFASLPEIIDEFGQKLARMRAKIEHTLRVDPQDLEGVQRELLELRDICEQCQTETVELLMTPAVDSDLLLGTLTPREREVANLMADGLSNEEIGTRLVISEFTVKTHVTRILRKFGVRQRAAVVARLRPYR